MEIVKYLAELIFTTALVIHGILFIPQAVKIWMRKSAAGVSLLTFLGFNIVQLSACIHGYFAKDYPLMLGTGFSLITCGCVTVSILFFNYCRVYKQ